MKLEKKLEDSLNTQINYELQSSYNYLAMSAWFETTPYKGFSSWMKKQSGEEQMHAMKFYEYLLDRGGSINLLNIEKPDYRFDTPLSVFKSSLDQEEKVSDCIRSLYVIADELNDYAAKHFLNWFLEEQVEEEKAVKDMIDRLELVGDHPAGLLRLDAEAAARPE